MKVIPAACKRRIFAAGSSNEELTIKAIPADLRSRTYRFGPNDVRTFEAGAITVHGDLGFELEPVPRTKSNPMPRLSALSRAARVPQSAVVTMGFNKRGRAPKSVTAMRKRVLAFVREIRREEVEMAFKEGYATPSAAGGDVGMSFVDQKGCWERLGDTEDDAEDGIRIVFWNIIEEDHGEFKNDMEYIAGMLARKFDQDAVVVEHMRGGVVQEQVFMGRK